MKKITGFIFTIIIMALALTACGNGNDDPPADTGPDPVATAPPTADNDTPPADTVSEREMLTVSVTNWDVARSFATDGQPCEIYAYVQERFGLIFVPYDISWDNVWELPYLWAAAGTLPDIIGASNRATSPTLHEWREAGVIRSIPNNLSPWPNINNWVSQPFVQNLAIDGEVYFIPRGTTLDPGNTSMERGIINRRDWREQLNIPIPQTEDDFIAMWRAFMDNDMHGDGTQVFGVYPHSTSDLFNQTFAGHGNTRNAWTPVDGRMVIPAFEPSAIPLISFWRRAFNEGVVNPDFLTDPSNTSIQQFALGRAGTLLRHISPVHLFNVYDQWQLLQPDINFFDAVEILAPPQIEGKTTEFIINTGFWSETLFNSSLDDYALSRVMDFFDWQLSDEGINMMMFGFYGRDYTIENGEIVILTDINPDTGRHMTAGDLYQFAAGGMNHLAIWSSDAVEWTSPNIPSEIREMAGQYRDNVILAPGATFVINDARINAINIPEVREMGLPSVYSEWVTFMTDRSDTDSQQLWEQFRARWESAGLLRAQELMTDEAIARGLIN